MLLGCLLLLGASAAHASLASQDQASCSIAAHAQVKWLAVSVRDKKNNALLLSFDVHGASKSLILSCARDTLFQSQKPLPCVLARWNNW